MTARSPAADDGSDEALALLRDARPAPGPAAETRPTGQGRAEASGDRPAPRHRASAWADARNVAARAGRAATFRSHRVPLEQALGEILTEPLAALTDLPSFDTSAMDGWVVAGPGPWALQDGGVLAGTPRPAPSPTAMPYGSPPGPASRPVPPP